MRRLLPLVLLAVAWLVVPAQAQLLPSAAVTEAHVSILPPHLVKVVPGAEQRLEVRVQAFLPCTGEAPQALQLYVATGRSYTEGHANQTAVKVWEITPDLVTVPWGSSPDGYRIDTYATFVLRSEGWPREETDHPLLVANTATGQGQGSCPGPHQIPAVMGQGAILAPLAPAVETTRDSPPGGLGALLLGGAVALALGRGR